MKPAANFHGYVDTQLRVNRVFHPSTGWIWQEHSKHTKTEERKLSYRFTLHTHPYVPQLVERLINDKIPGLLGADLEYERGKDGRTVPLLDDKGKTQRLADGTPVPRPVLYESLFTSTHYAPGSLVEHPYPAKELDFSSSGAYSGYNWELFYHIPMTIAVNLSQNQRFEEAQKWFHYVFDPTDDSDGPTPERFWKVRPFQCTDMKRVEQTLVNLATSNDPALAQETLSAIDAWKNNPFQPFLVARYRQSAFQFKAVMAYLDNLIAWGDSLFLQYTGESINEAAQIYILAANILGPRPQRVPGKTRTAPQSYASLRSHVDAFGNALVDLETEVPLHNAPHPRKAAPSSKLNSLSSIGHGLYFCTPNNTRMLQYWDTVADRLFKIHNSLNIEGVFQRVPLFDPPIDPAMLVRAAAAGLNVADIVAGVNQPLPLVRFRYLLLKATEACQEVKSLGGALLAALEKHDNETLGLLRAKHETTLLQLGEMLKYSTYQEAKKNLEGLQHSLTQLTAKYTYYQRLQGAKDSDIKLEKMAALDTEGLNKLDFSAEEPVVPQGGISYDYSKSPDSAGGVIITTHESHEMDMLTAAHDAQEAVHAARAVAAAVRPIPDTALKLAYWGIGGAMQLPGGTVLAAYSEIAAEIASAVADQFTFEATNANKIAGYANRLRDYQFQSNAAAGEITQIYKQIRAAEIRQAIAERDWKNHRKQIDQAQAVEQFLADKPSNQALYAWLKRETKALYNKEFQLAFEIARQAERALQQELGDPKLSYIQYGYLAGMQGLLAGERLAQDIRRMDMAYTELNKREYELTKHVSLLQQNPQALLQLRTRGTCRFDVPEEAFDFDGPGQYFRRIRTVALSIPCVTGPYTSLNCRLTLLKSSIRATTLAGDGGYPRSSADDSRFSDYSGSIESIVSSNGQNDSGLFEVNPHEDRKLPFEWSGAISQWQLDLPAQVRTFDYDSIADVILQIRYTAREGGEGLKKLAVDNLEAVIGSGNTTGSVRLFSMRHEFPSEWAKFRSFQLGTAGPVAPLTFKMRPEHYPFWSTGRLQAVLGVTLYAQSSKDLTLSDAADGTGHQDSLTTDDSLSGGMRSGQLKNIALPAPTGPWSFYFSDNSLDDLWIAVMWGKQQ